MPLKEKNLELALLERVKELTCLYSIARLAVQTELSLDETMQRITDLLPFAWQYPEITSARIVVDGRTFLTRGFSATAFQQLEDIVVDREKCGEVLIVYSEQRPEADEGPFLKEERNLLNAVASELTLIVERRRAEEDRAKLTEQLLHTDRLATIGRLAAGVAHELNEPLAGILGLAQLARRAADLPEEVASDLDKIVKASLHAREIIRSLLLFARRVPPVRTAVQLNDLVDEALDLLEPRRTRTGVDLKKRLEEGLPEVTADAAQIRQILVNLVMNALQAMPSGGTLEIRTRIDAETVVVAVSDTGTGMTDDVRSQLYVPFFTTKDVGEGTGLGLAVVQGVVSSHGGTIQVESEPGRGSTFEVRFPLAPRHNPDTGSKEARG